MHSHFAGFIASFALFSFFSTQRIRKMWNISSLMLIKICGEKEYKILQTFFGTKSQRETKATNQPALNVLAIV